MSIRVFTGIGLVGAAGIEPATSVRAKKVFDAQVDPNEIPSPSEVQSIAAVIQPRNLRRESWSGSELTSR
jgi:hypothetical protein